MISVKNFLRVRWKLAVALGLALVLVSLVLLSYALLPPGDPVRLQVTLAPTLFVPPPGGLP